MNKYQKMASKLAKKDVKVYGSDYRISKNLYLKSAKEWPSNKFIEFYRWAIKKCY